MTKSTGTRLYRACIRCRQRKTKCDLKYTSEHGFHPCSRCSAEGYSCVVASSRRGGDYSQFRNRHRNQTGRHVTVRDANDSGNRLEPPVKQTVNNISGETQDHGLCRGIQNPLEALQILAQTASSEKAMEMRAAGSTQPCADHLPMVEVNTQGPANNHHLSSSPSLLTTELIINGIVEPQLVEPLLQYYINNYHTYLPIVPSHLLHPGSHEQLWAKESFLLTAVLTIATQDRLGLEGLHTRILSHMEKLLLRVVLGATSVRHVGSVEGLLLLAEWVPHISSEASSDELLGHSPVEQSETTEEDSVAWNLIGMAVRQAYLLRLEKQAFRGEVGTESESVCSRKRLAWIFTYLADRQISIQMGQAFWCRGPGLGTRFTAHDYPTLRPQGTGGTDYASFIQAQVDLTTVFGNVHDILYASKARTVQLILMGDYTKYLDDSAKALDMWKETWNKLEVPCHLSTLLTLQFEYLRLYINAFAFQAVLYRSTKDTPVSEHDKTVSYFPYSVMASPDGRHIYIAIDAAKNVLKKLMERLNPSKHLRFLPVRFYLYEIHASVFLFKAYSVGALTSEEYQACFTLTRQFISMLKSAATSRKHIAYRYGKLLAGLWFQGHTTPEAAVYESSQSIDTGQKATSSMTQQSADNSRESEIIIGAPEENTDLQSPFEDMFSNTAHMPFVDSLEILDCPDAFLSNLPFLRASLPNFDDSDVNHFHDGSLI